MDSLLLLARQHLRNAWRRRWLGVLAAWVICIAGWAGVMAIPNQYEASARLYVDVDSVLTPLLRGIAVDSAPTSQLEVLQRTLLSRPNIEKLISKTGLDLSITSAADHERLYKHLANDIRVQSQTKTLFTISYRDRNPKLAREVVNALLTIFIESASGGSRMDMDNARRFLEGQIASYQQQLRAAEQRRADFRARYAEVLPGGPDSSVPAVESARTQVTLLDGRLQDQKLARDALRRELESTPRMLVTEAGGLLPGSGPAPLKLRLQEAEDQLRVLLLKDTEQHPDVIAQKKLIEALKAEQARRPAASANAPAAIAAGGRSASNPVYEQLRLKLVEADTNLVSLERQRDEAVRNRDRLEKIQHDQPGLIAEYQNMDRDYGVLRKNYEELLARLQSANIAQAAETQADKVKLQIVDPVQVPRLPVSPNRLLLFTGVLLAGIGGGIAGPVLLGQLDQSFIAAEDLRRLGRPVLGGISLANRASARTRLMAAFSVGAAVTVLIIIYGGLMLHVLRGTALI